MIDVEKLIKSCPSYVRNEDKYFVSRYRLDCEEEFETASKMWLKNNPLDEVIKREKKKMDNRILTNNTVLTFGGKRCEIKSFEEHHDALSRKWTIRVTADLPDEVKLVDRFSKNYEYKKYCDNDIRTTNAVVTALKNSAFPAIKNVIFNPPATIVFWNDNTKTIVKCENEGFDPEKGLAMAVTKKALGNKGNYFETIKKWTNGAPNGECVSDLMEAYNQGRDDKWDEVKEMIEKFEDRLVVGNRVTKKLYNDFLDIFTANKKEDNK